ncbi:amidase [Ureibacillus composti]|nr:amidase [Ureibacillus composti]
MKNILQLSIHEASELIKEKQLSPVDLVEALIERIEETNPLTNAYITVREKEELLEEAKRCELEILNGQYKGPLHGIPISIKDMIFTKDIKTTMGSAVYKDYVPTEDAIVVQRLKQAGAIIVGKVNTHEFAYGPTGDESHFGPVRNPHHLNKISGGSSSGSAASVSSFTSFGSIGTDTGGSIRIPASYCGVVGMKPTYGKVSSDDVYALSWNLDHVGPITRTVKDNILMYNAIVESEEIHIGDSVKELNDLKIAIPQNYFFDDLDEDVRVSVNGVVNLLKENGATVEIIKIPQLEEITEHQKTILRTEAYANNKENFELDASLFGAEVRERLLTGIEVKGHEYAWALKRKNELTKQSNALFNHFDVLITPTIPILPPNIKERTVRTDADNKDAGHIRWTILKNTSPFNYLGLPAISIPCGVSTTGLPIGLQIISKSNNEQVIYETALALEEKLNIETTKWEIERKS